VQERNSLEGQLVQQSQRLKEWEQQLPVGKQIVGDLIEKLRPLLHDELPAIVKALGSQKNLLQKQQAHQTPLTAPHARATPFQLSKSLGSL